MNSEYLKAARIEAGLSQRALAERCDASESYVRALESGYTPRNASPVLDRIVTVLATELHTA